MEGNKPSWMCRACQERFHFVCLDQRSCNMDYGYRADHNTDADNPYMRTNCSQINTENLHNPDRQI